MQIVEFTAGSLRFAEGVPTQAPVEGFVWVYLDRAEYLARAVDLQGIAQRLGGSPLLDVHVKDLASDVHPSGYDATSVYDLIVFRRLATANEVRPGSAEAAAAAAPAKTCAMRAPPAKNFACCPLR